MIPGDTSTFHGEPRMTREIDMVNVIDTKFGWKVDVIVRKDRLALDTTYLDRWASELGVVGKLGVARAAALL